MSYIRIWEDAHGPIPRDSTGRKMEIHHRDGNKNNNTLENLQLVTIQEHYEIHLSQKDYAACQLIAIRMNMSSEEISYFAREAQIKKVKDGTHHLLGPSFNKKRVENGNHHWLDGTKSSQTQIALIESGKHHFVNSDWQKENQLRLIANGRHNFVGGEIQKRLINEGTHHFLINNPGKFSWTCQYCDKVGQGKTNYTRWHGDKCKKRV